MAGPDFLSMRRVFVKYSQPIRFARFDCGFLVFDKARVLDPCCRPEGLCALGTRMGANLLIEAQERVLRD